MLKIGVYTSEDKFENFEFWRIWDNIRDIRYRSINLNTKEGLLIYKESKYKFVANAVEGHGDPLNGAIYRWKDEDADVMHVIVDHGYGEEKLIVFSGRGYILNDEGQTVERIS